MNRKEIYTLLDDVIPHQARVAISRVLEEEQGQSTNNIDRGGHTNWGISSRWYPNICISDLTASCAANIYYRDYWLKYGCNRLPADLALITFDVAVNQGGTLAVTLLQSLIKVKVDGIIGSKTVKAAYQRNTLVLLTKLTAARCREYSNLAQRDNSQIIFIEGWIDRALDILVDAQIIALGGER